MYTLSEYWKKRGIKVFGFTCDDCYNRIVKIDPASKALLPRGDGHKFSWEKSGPEMDFAFEKFSHAGEFIHIEGEAHLDGPQKFKDNYLDRVMNISPFVTKGKFKRRNTEELHGPYTRRPVTIHWDKPLFGLNIPAKKK